MIKTTKETNKLNTKMKELMDSAGARAYQADLDVYNSEKQL